MKGHRFNPEKAEKLLDPKRKAVIQPEKILALLQIKETDIIADLGAGNGFFTIPFAELTKETVHAVDIEPKMLALLKKRAVEHGLSNIRYVESDLEQINLPDDSVHIAFTAFVMHEIPNMDRAVKEFKRIIKPGGRLLILDWEAVESEMGPPLDHRISSATMSALLRENGFTPTIEKIHESVYAALVDNER